MADSKDKKPIYRRVWFWIIIVILVGGIASASNGGSKSSSSASSSSVASTASSSSSTQVTNINIADMKKEYETSNQAAADEKYKGKTLEFTGKVTKVQEGTFGGYDVYVDGGVRDNNQFMTTDVIINTKDEKAKSIANGSNATFDAKFSSALLMSDSQSGEQWVATLNFSNATIK